MSTNLLALVLITTNLKKKKLLITKLWPKKSFSDDDNWALMSSLDKEICQRYKAKFGLTLENCT